MNQIFVIAWRNLLQHRRRSLMLGGAIAGATALLVLLTCLASGVKRSMITGATTVSTGHLNVGGYYKITAGQTAPMVTDYKKIRATVEKTLGDELEFVAPRGRGWARLVSDQGSMQCGIAGVDLAGEPRLPKVLKMLEGNLADLAKPGSVLIFASQAKKLKVKTGDSMVFSVLTDRNVNNTVDVRVIGVAEDMGIMTGWNVFVPEETLLRLNDMNDSVTGALLIYIKDMDRIPQAIDKLRKALQAEGHIVIDRAPKAFWMKMMEMNKEDWTGQKLDVTSWEDEVSFLIYSLTAINGLSVVLTGMLLIIIAIGIMNTMWIAIRERTREIGTLRAIGMQRRLVLAMFVIETFLLGLAGTAAGAAIGGFFAFLLNLAKIGVPEGAQFFTMASTLNFAFEPGKIFAAGAIITLCVTLVSLIPAFKAARMKPVTAMSHL
jgi:putative ABC transport system permease protein